MSQILKLILQTRYRYIPVYCSVCNVDVNGQNEIEQSHQIGRETMKNRKLQLAIVVGVVALAAQTHAALYDITFTGFDNLTTATGQVDVVGNVALSGYLDVTYNGTTVDYNNLVPTGGTGETSGGLNLGPVDNVFNVNSATQGGFLTVSGLVFYNGASYSDRTSAIMALSDNTPSDLTPNLYGGGSAEVGGFGNNTPDTDGTLGVFAAVPEPTWTAGVTGFAAVGMLILVAKRKKYSMMG